MLRTILKPLSFVPALIMMYIIFSFSAQDGDMSGQLSYQASVKIIETADYVFNANLSYDQIDEWANKIDLSLANWHIWPNISLLLSQYPFH